MKAFLISLLISFTMAEQRNSPMEEQRQSIMYNVSVGRNSVEAEPGYFDISGPYVRTFLYSLAIILAVELAYGIANTLTGRSARNLLGGGSVEVFPHSLAEAAEEVYSAIERYQHRDMPRSLGGTF